MDFIVKNYVIIIIIVAFIIFALIGYVVDSMKNKDNKEKELLTRPNDDVDVNLIKEDTTEENNSVSEDVTSVPFVNENNNENTDN